MTSLRWTALLWMTAMLSIVGIAGAAVSYRLASDEANAFLDSQLQQIALNALRGRARHDGFSSLPARFGRRLLCRDLEWGRRGVSCSRSAVYIPRRSQAGFADVHAAGEDWRVYTSNGRRSNRAGRAS